MKKFKGEKRDPEERNVAAPGALDLTPILASWEYDETRDVRRLTTSEGRDVLQVRLPLGIEQYELTGRPDGKRPMDAESWLHYYSRGAESVDPGTSEPFLRDTDFERLFQEGLLFYNRYVLFFRIQEYRLCARDTRRNLRLLDFVKRHARPELAEQLEQYRPYILRMHVMSRALLRIQTNGDVRGALKLLRDGRRTIEQLATLEGNRVFEFERARALSSLEDVISQLEAQTLTEEDKLARQLEAAIREENYEKAATIRDEIQRVKQRQKRSEVT